MRMVRRLLVAGLPAFISMVALAAVQTAGADAAVIEVTTTADQAGAAPGCSLRQAITAAQTDSTLGGCQAGAGADSIQLPAGVYRLTIPGMGELNNMTGDLNVTGGQALTIEPAGAGRVVIDAGGIDRVLSHAGPGSLSIRSLTIRGGRLNMLADGGGIVNAGTLTLDRVTLVDNSAAQGDGGALANYGNATITNSTIAGNSAQRSGGGIYGPGGSSTTLRSVTINRNAADAFGTNSGDGGGVVTVGVATLNATNTVIAGNFDNSPGAGTVVKDCATTPNFFPRYTLIGERDPVRCLIGFDPGTNLTGDAKLGPIADNGGPGPTVLPAADSPLIDAGGSAAPDLCPARDQRGVTRPQGAGCDIGALERDPQGLDAPGGGGGGAAAQARLRLANPRPRVARARPGRVVRFRVRVRNRGDAAARRMRVCLRLNTASRRALKPLGRRCTKPRNLAAGRQRVVRFRLRVRAGASPARRVVRFLSRPTRGPSSTGRPPPSGLRARPPRRSAGRGRRR